MRDDKARIKSQSKLSLSIAVLLLLLVSSAVYYAYAASFSVTETNPPFIAPYVVNGTSSQLLNFTITNNDAAENITLVNISLPSGFSFISGTKGSDAAGVLGCFTPTGESSCNWTYRIPITVNNSQNAESLTNFQVLVNLTGAIYNNTGLAGSWHFQENNSNITLDSSGYSNHGSMYDIDTVADNTPASGRVSSGKYGYGIAFNGGFGSIDYIQVPNSPILEGMGAITIEGWIKPGTIEYLDRIVDKTLDSLGNSGSYAVFFDSSTTKLVFKAFNSTSSNSVSSDSGISSGSWTHFAAAYNGTNMLLYINGALQADIKQFSGAINSSGAKLIFGANSPSGSPNNIFDGTMDEIRIYNRALASSEISDRYASAKSRPDYHDIRVTWLNTTSNAEESISFWMQNDNYAWLKIPSIRASSNETAYLYYGSSNASLSSQSNISAAFVIGDDFSGSAYNSANSWTGYYWNDSTDGVINGRLRIQMKSGADLFSRDNGTVLYLPEPAGNYTVDVDLFGAAAWSAAHQQAGLIAYNNNDSYLKFIYYYSSTPMTLQWGNESNDVFVPAASSANNLPVWDPVFLRMAKVSGSYSAYNSSDGRSWNLFNQSVARSSDYIGLLASPYSTTLSAAYFDNFRVRKYAAIEPNTVLRAFEQNSSVSLPVSESYWSNATQAGIIPAGATRRFWINASAPSAIGNYTINITTKDTAGASVTNNVTLNITARWTRFTEQLNATTVNSSGHVLVSGQATLMPDNTAVTSNRVDVYDISNGTNWLTYGGGSVTWTTDADWNGGTHANTTNGSADLILNNTLSGGSYSWLYNNWDYRKKITINGSTAQLTNYSVLINLTNRSLSSDNFDFSKANSQSNDTRFTWLNSSSGLEQSISFWIENWMSSGSAGNATIWVNIPNVTASTVANTTIYIYYGNSAASSASNGTNTFMVWDDFNGGAEKWTEVDPNNMITIDRTANKRINFTNLGGSQNAQVRYDAGSVQDFVYDIEINISAITADWGAVDFGLGDVAGNLGGGGAGDQNNAVYFSYLHAGTGGDYTHYLTATNSGSASSTSLVDSSSVGKLRYMRLVRSGSNTSLYVFTDPARTVQISGSPISIVSPTVSLRYLMAASNYINGAGRSATGYSDNALLRNYTSPEPSVLSVGGPEAAARRGQYTSNTTSSTDAITSVIVSYTKTEPNSNVNLTVEISANNGANWLLASSGSTYTSGGGIGSGTQLKYRVNFTTNDTSQTARLHDIILTYRTPNYYETNTTGGYNYTFSSPYAGTHQIKANISSALGGIAQAGIQNVSVLINISAPSAVSLNNGDYNITANIPASNINYPAINLSSVWANVSWSGGSETIFLSGDVSGGIWNKTYAPPAVGTINITFYANLTDGFNATISANTAFNNIFLNNCTDLIDETSTYLLARNVSSSATCFTIKANNVTLDGQGYTINYSQTSTGYAVKNIGGYNNITIKNLNIVQGNSSNSLSYAIYALSMNNSKVQYNNITASGSASYGIFISSSNANLISNNIIATAQSDSYGIYLVASSSNNITNNRVTTSGNDAYGIYPWFNSNANLVSDNNVTTSGSTAYAIPISGSASNTIIRNTLKTSNINSYGVYAASTSTSNNIMYNNITTTGSSAYGIVTASSSSSNNISDNTVSTPAYGLYISTASNKVWNNNITTTSGSGVYLSGSSNRLWDNYITASGSSGYGIDLSGGANNITGGSIVSRQSYDYYLSGAITTSNFTGTNFTAQRRIYFYNSTFWFNYNNQTDGNIWLKTNVSTAAYINRTLVTWSQSSMGWNDTNGTTGLTAKYNLTGLLANTFYDIYNTSGSTRTKAYSLQTDSSGALSFEIALNGNTLINVSQDLIPPAISVQSPLSQFYTGSVWFNITLDETGSWAGYSLDGAANITLSNDSTTHFYGQNTSMADGTHTATFYANDSAGNIGVSPSISFTVDTISPYFSFSSPTLSNGSLINRNWAESNITIVEPNPDTFLFNWNGTNYSFYDFSLVLLMNFNNNSAIGENSTYAVDISKYGNNGTLYNGTQVCGDRAGCPSFVSGKFGNGLQFDGVNDYVDAGAAASLNITGDITIETWINPLSINTVNSIVTKGTAGANYGYFFAIGSAYGNSVNFQLANETTGTTHNLNGNVTLSTNTWHHVVGLRNGNVMQVYVNGALSGQITNFSGAIRKSGVNLNVGKYGSGSYFNGTIDEVRIYNRSLSAAEIAMHYQSEFKKYNATDWGFYINTTNLTDGTYSYYGWANDSSGNANVSETRTVTIDTVMPSLTLVNPTAANNSYIGQNYTFINATASENNVSMALRDSSLVLGMHFERGSNDTQAVDFSQYGNNGTLTSMNLGLNNCTGNCSGWTTSGKFGNGIVFDGVNDYVDLGNNTALRTATSESKTYSMWIKTEFNKTGILISPAQYDYIYVEGTGANYGKVGFRHSGGSNDYIYSNVINDNVWHHVAVTIERATAKYYIYTDGSLSNSYNFASNKYFGSTNQNVMIGKRTAIAYIPFNGTIDEVRIYNRSLSASEIASIYNASVGNYRQFEANRTGLAEGSYSYYVEAIDQAGNINQSETRTVTTDYTLPFIEFAGQTDSNNAFVSRNWTYINATVTDSSPNSTGFIDFNRSLVGWWRFNREAGENDTFARDWSSYGNNGTLTGMNLGIDNGTSGWTSSGKFGNALQFDGVNDYVNLGTNAKPSYVTVEAWINPKNNTNAQAIVSVDDAGASQRGYRISLSNTNAIFIIYGATGSEVTASTGIIPQNAWTHIAATYEGSRKIVYLNGVVVQNISAAIGTINYTGNNITRIGNRDRTTDDMYFNGTIDEVKIWNRALSPEEINASFNSGSYRLYHNFTSLADGAYNYTAYAQDLAGSVNQTETRTVTIDTTPPSVTINSPAAASQIYSQSNKTITINYTYTETNAVNATIYLLNATETINSTAITGLSNGTVTRTDTILIPEDTADGNYSINVTVFDVAGNQGDSQQNNSTVVDNTKPALTFVSPTTANSSVIGQNYTFINATASEDNVLMALRDSSLVVGLHLESINGTNRTQDFSQYDNSGLSANGSSAGCYGPDDCIKVVSGKFGNALQFDEAYDNLMLGSNERLSPNSSLTWSFWIKYNNGTVTRIFLTNRYSFTNKQGLLVYVAGAGNKMVFRLGNGTGFTDITASSFFSNDWEHYAGVYNGTNVILYRNGIAEASTPRHDYINYSSPVNMRFGGDGSSTAGSNSTLDEFMLYNRSLSASEIASIYNASVGNYRQFEANRTGLAEGSYSYYVEAIDQAGNINQSETRTVTTDYTVPFIEFAGQTDSNNAFMNRNWTYINATVTDANNITAFINFNNSLSAWLKMNEGSGTTASDASGYSNTLTLYDGNTTNADGNTLPIWTDGRFGKGLQFDGNDDYANMNPSASLKINNTLTIEAWIKTNDSSKAEAIIVQQSGSGLTRNYQFHVGSGGLRFYHGNGSSTDMVISGLNVTDNNWHHVAVTTSGTTATFFKDGVSAVKALAFPVKSNDGVSVYKIGGISATYLSSAFNGTIDEVKIWNRALSPEEINASFNSGSYRLYHNFTSLADGAYNYTAYAQDLAGNVNQTETRTVNIDTTPPTITIQSPENTTYSSTNAIWFNITGSETLSWAGYSLDGAANVTLTNSSGNWTNQNTSVPAGAHNAVFYANDSAGNMNSATVYFTVTSLISCQDLSLENAVYRLAANVSSDAACFNIMANNITLDGQGYTINYSKTTSGYAVNGTGYNFTTIKNTNIIQENSGVSGAKTAIYLSGIVSATIFNNSISVSDAASWSNAIYLINSNSSNITNNRIINGNRDYGIRLDSGSSLNNISNNNITINAAGSSTYGIHLATPSNSNNISSNTLVSSGDSGRGIYITSSSNTIDNNNITTSGTSGYGVWLPSGGNSNVFVNNTILTSNTFSPAISISADSNNIIGGSIIAQQDNTYDIGASTNNNFTDTNFTAKRSVYFRDASSWFNYNNQTNGNIWLKTNVSTEGKEINRTLVTWSQQLMKWNDTGSSVTARYNITGLMANSNYYIYNTSGTGMQNSYLLAADASGVLPSFTISLNGDTEIRAVASNVDTCRDLDAENATYVLTANVSSDAACFNIMANNITLDGNGYTINYSQSATGYAVNNSGGYNFTTVKNLNIIQANASVGAKHAIYFNRAANSTIANNTFDIAADNPSLSSVIYLNLSTANTIANNVIVSGTWNDGIYFYLSNANTLSNNTITVSSDYDEEGIYLDTSNTNTLSNNNIIVSGSNGNGIRLSSSNASTFSNNTVTTSGSGSEGIYLSSSITNTFSNNTVTTSGNSSEGIRLSSSSNSNTFSNNNITTSGYNSRGIRLSVSSTNTFSNNTVTTSGDDGEGIYLASSSNSNTFSDNTVTTSGGGSEGIYLWLSSSSNNIIGGSVISQNSFEYYLSGVGALNNFTDTNFTAKRGISFSDVTSWFNYRNNSAKNIWLKTNVSAAANINRTLANWSQPLMKWNDTGSSVTARYNITGLLPNRQYNIYNTTAGIESNPYNITSDENGDLASFTVALNGETQIKAESIIHLSEELNATVVNPGELVLVSGHAYSGSVDIASTNVSVYQDNVMQGDAATNATGRYNYTFTASSIAGTHSIKANITDSYGAYGENSTDLGVRINLSSPSAISTATGNNNANVGENINFSVNAANVGSVNISSVWANITTASQIVMLSGSASGGIWSDASYQTAVTGTNNVTFYANLTDGFSYIMNATAQFFVKGLNISYSINDSAIYVTETSLINGTIYSEPEHTVSSNTPLNITANYGSADAGGKTADSNGAYNFTYNYTSASSITYINFTLNATDSDGIKGITYTPDASITVYPPIQANITTDHSWYDIGQAINATATVFYGSSLDNAQAAVKFTVLKGGYRYPENVTVNESAWITADAAGQASYAYAFNESGKYYIAVTANNSAVNRAITATSAAVYAAGRINATISVSDDAIYDSETTTAYGTVYDSLSQTQRHNASFVALNASGGAFSESAPISNATGDYNSTYIPPSVSAIQAFTLSANATDSDGLNSSTVSRQITVYPSISVDTWASATSACSGRINDFNDTGAIFLCANVSYQSSEGQGGETVRFMVYKTGINNEQSYEPSANPVFNVTNATASGGLAYTSVTLNESSRYTLNATAWNSQVNSSATASDGHAFEFGQLNVSSVSYDSIIYASETAAISGILRDFMNASWLNNMTSGTFVNITATSGTFNANSAFVNSTGGFNFTYTPDSGITSQTTAAFEINASYGNIIGNWSGTILIYPSINLTASKAWTDKQYYNKDENITFASLLYANNGGLLRNAAVRAYNSNFTAPSYIDLSERNQTFWNGTYNGTYAINAGNPAGNWTIDARTEANWETALSDTAVYVNPYKVRATPMNSSLVSREIFSQKDKVYIDVFNYIGQNAFDAGVVIRDSSGQAVNAQSISAIAPAVSKRVNYQLDRDNIGYGKQYQAGIWSAVVNTTDTAGNVSYRMAEFYVLPDWWSEDSTGSAYWEYRVRVLLNNTFGIARTNVSVEINGSQLQAAGVNLSNLDVSSLRVVDIDAADSGTEIGGHALLYNTTAATSFGQSDAIRFKANVSENSRKAYYIYYSEVAKSSPFYIGNAEGPFFPADMNYAKEDGETNIYRIVTDKHVYKFDETVYVNASVFSMHPANTFVLFEFFNNTGDNLNANPCNYMIENVQDGNSDRIFELNSGLAPAALSSSCGGYGTWQVKVSANDESVGSVGSFEQSGYYNFTVNELKIPFTVTPSSFDVGAWITIDGGVYLASDGSAAGGANVTIKRDGAAIYTNITNGTGHFNYTYQELTPGSHTISVESNKSYSFGGTDGVNSTEVTANSKADISIESQDTNKDPNDAPTFFINVTRNYADVSQTIDIDFAINDTNGLTGYSIARKTIIVPASGSNSTSADWNINSAAPENYTISVFANVSGHTAGTNSTWFNRLNITENILPNSANTFRNLNLSGFVGNGAANSGRDLEDLNITIIGPENYGYSAATSAGNYNMTFGVGAHGNYSVSVVAAGPQYKGYSTANFTVNYTANLTIDTEVSEMMANRNLTINVTAKNNDNASVSQLLTNITILNASGSEILSLANISQGYTALENKTVSVGWITRGYAEGTYYARARAYFEGVLAGEINKTLTLTNYTATLNVGLNASSIKANQVLGINATTKNGDTVPVSGLQTNITLLDSAGNPLLALLSVSQNYTALENKTNATSWQTNATSWQTNATSPGTYYIKAAAYLDGTMVGEANQSFEINETRNISLSVATNASSYSGVGKGVSISASINRTGNVLINGTADIYIIRYDGTRYEADINDSGLWTTSNISFTGLMAENAEARWNTQNFHNGTYHAYIEFNYTDEYGNPVSLRANNTFTVLPEWGAAISFYAPAQAEYLFSSIIPDITFLINNTGNIELCDEIGECTIWVSANETTGSHVFTQGGAWQDVNTINAGENITGDANYLQGKAFSEDPSWAAGIHAFNMTLRYDNGLSVENTSYSWTINVSEGTIILSNLFNTNTNFSANEDVAIPATWQQSGGNAQIELIERINITTEPVSESSQNFTLSTSSSETNNIVWNTAQTAPGIYDIKYWLTSKDSSLPRYFNTTVGSSMLNVTVRAAPKQLKISPTKDARIVSIGADKQSNYTISEDAVISGSVWRRGNVNFTGNLDVNITGPAGTFALDSSPLCDNSSFPVQSGTNTSFGCTWNTASYAPGVYNISAAFNWTSANYTFNSALFSIDSVKAASASIASDKDTYSMGENISIGFNVTDTGNDNVTGNISVDFTGSENRNIYQANNIAISTSSKYNNTALWNITNTLSGTYTLKVSYNYTNSTGAAAVSEASKTIAISQNTAGYAALALDRQIYGAYDSVNMSFNMTAAGNINYSVLNYVVTINNSVGTVASSSWASVGRNATVQSNASWNTGTSAKGNYLVSLAVTDPITGAVWTANATFAIEDIIIAGVSGVAVDKSAGGYYDITGAGDTVYIAGGRIGALGNVMNITGNVTITFKNQRTGSTHKTVECAGKTTPYDINSSGCIGQYIIINSTDGWANGRITMNVSFEYDNGTLQTAYNTTTFQVGTTAITLSTETANGNSRSTFFRNDEVYVRVKVQNTSGSNVAGIAASNITSAILDGASISVSSWTEKGNGEYVFGLGKRALGSHTLQLTVQDPFEGSSGTKSAAFSVSDHTVVVSLESASLSAVSSASDKYVASAFSGNTVAAVIFRGEAFNGIESAADSMGVNQSMEGNNVYLVFTKGAGSAITGRIKDVLSGAFEKYINPTFGYSKDDKNIVSIALEYAESGMNLDGDMALAAGTYTFVIKNEGVQSGKTVVSIRRK